MNFMADGAGKQYLENITPENTVRDWILTVIALGAFVAQVLSAIPA